MAATVWAAMPSLRYWYPAASPPPASHRIETLTDKLPNREDDAAIGNEVERTVVADLADELRIDDYSSYL